MNRDTSENISNLMQSKLWIYNYLLNHRRIVILGLLSILLLFGFFQIGQTKQREMQKAITQVKLADLKITVGGSGKSLGTAFFGTLTNETNKPISILTLKVDFLDEDGEVSKTHDFFPINRYSKNDWEPLAPDSIRSFGFFIDDIVPENWSGLYEAEITKLVF